MELNSESSFADNNSTAFREFASTLLHEVAHTRSEGASDLSKPFEDALTGLLGEVAESAICN
jgi:translation elongation factor EF-Ts